MEYKHRLRIKCHCYKWTILFDVLKLLYYRFIIYVFSHFVLCFGPQNMMSQFLLYNCINYMHQEPAITTMCTEYHVVGLWLWFNPSTSHETVTVISCKEIIMLNLRMLVTGCCPMFGLVCVFSSESQTAQ